MDNNKDELTKGMKVAKNTKKKAKKAFFSAKFILTSLPLIGLSILSVFLVSFVLFIGALQATGAFSDCANGYTGETESVSAITSSDASGIDPFTPGTKAYENAKAFFEKGIESGIGGIAMAGLLGNNNSEGSFDIIGRAEGHYTMTEADSIANGAVPGNSGYGYAVGGGGIWQITPYTDYAPLNSPDWEDIDKMWQFMVDRINGVHPSSPGWKDWVNSYDYSGKNRSFIEWAMDTNIEDAAPGWNAHERGRAEAIIPALPKKIEESKKFAELFNADDYPADESKLRETFPSWFGGNATAGSKSSTGDGDDEDDEVVDLGDYDDEIGNGEGDDDEDDGSGDDDEDGGSGGGGDSDSAGQSGSLSSDAKEWAKNWEVTYIGDSLGAGSESFFKQYFKNVEYDSDVSRGINQIRGINTGETGVDTLKRLISENRVKKNLVVALGTNNDVSSSSLQQFYDLIPSSVETITWVLSGSKGEPGFETINPPIREFVNNHSDRMRYLDFEKFVDGEGGGWDKFADVDGIHMTSEGYRKYVDFQTQGLYELWGDGSSGGGGNTSSDSDDAKLWEETANESNPEEAGLKPHVAHAKRFLAKKFGITDFSLFRNDNEGTGFGHGSGYSIDLMCDLETGKKITDYIATKEFMKNMQIFYIMHNHKTFFDRTNIYGDAYTWNDVPDRGSATANHEDHVHITFDGNQDGNIHPEGGGMISSGKSAKSNNKKNKCTSSSSSGGSADGGHPYKNDYYLASGFHKYSFGFGGMGTGHHSGVDLTGEPTGVGSQHPSNDEIFAVLDGEVVRDGNNDYGIIIIKTEGIGDEPLYLEYTHTVVGSSKVSVGDKVSKGDLIAQEGETGSNLSTGCQPCFHLHFGVTYGVDNAYAYFTDDSAYSTDLSAKIIDPGYVLPGVGEGWLMTTHENYVGDDAIPFKIQVDGNTQHPRGLTADDAIK